VTVGASRFNVEVIGGTPMVQHYVEQIAEFHNMASPWSATRRLAMSAALLSQPEPTGIPRFNAHGRPGTTSSETQVQFEERGAAYWSAAFGHPLHRSRLTI
jgi:hypothetical protein